MNFIARQKAYITELTSEARPLFERSLSSLIYKWMNVISVWNRWRMETLFRYMRDMLHQPSHRKFTWTNRTKINSKHSDLLRNENSSFTVRSWSYYVSKSPSNCNLINVMNLILSSVLKEYWLHTGNFPFRNSLSVQFSFTTMNRVWNVGSRCHASNIPTYN